MAILVTSSNPLGLRALGSGGRTVMASYDQIARTLRQQLGADHAALFSEPSQRPGTIDWFASNEAADRKPVRLNEAEPERRERGLARLGALVRDIEAKAASLQRSDRQDERILGDMLAFALNIPDENAVFLVGDQPVLTFWGHVRDLGQPANNPLHALIQRASPLRADTSLPEANPGVGATTIPRTDPTEHIVYTTTTPPDQFVVQPPERSGTRLLAPVLWAVFTILLLTIGIELLRGGCAIGLPAPLTGYLINYCPAVGAIGGADALAAERSKQAGLQAEYDELVRRAELKRQACLIKPKDAQGPVTIKPPPKPTPTPNPTPTPAPTPPPVTPVADPGKVLQIPTKPTDKSFLEGCWKAHEGLTEIRDGKDTGHKLDETFCFNKDGSGDRTIRFMDDNAQCRGSAQARLDGDKLIVELGEAPCDSGHGKFDAAEDTCNRDATGAAKCDETDPSDHSTNFSDFPFTRVTEQP